MLKATDILQDFLFDRVYNVQSALPETEQARQVIRFLYAYFLKNPRELPPEYLLHSDKKWRGVIDYIAEYDRPVCVENCGRFGFTYPQKQAIIYSESLPFALSLCKSLC